MSLLIYYFASVFLRCQVPRAEGYLSISSDQSGEYCCATSNKGSLTTEGKGAESEEFNRMQD